MYVFGVDIPLVELIFALGVIGSFLVLEIMVVLFLITYHLRTTKKLEKQIARLMSSLLQLEEEELKEIDKLSNMTGAKIRKGLLKVPQNLKDEILGKKKVAKAKPVKKKSRIFSLKKK